MRKSSKIRLIQNLITTHAKQLFEVKYISKLYVSVEHQINETMIKYDLLSQISKDLQGKQQINSSGKQRISSSQWNDLEGSNGTSSIYFPNVQSAFLSKPIFIYWKLIWKPEWVQRTISKHSGFQKANADKIGPGFLGPKSGKEVFAIVTGRVCTGQVPKPI